jgi:NAD+ synthase (glutamine-hydrolysing)
MEELTKQKPDLLLNISASPFSAAHADERKDIVVKNARKYNIPVFYCNTIGAHTEILFDGGSLVCNNKGDTMIEMNYFEEDFKVVSLDDMESNRPTEVKEQTLTERKYHALILGIRDYFNKMGFKKAILGLSGGIDSALTCVLAAEALGSENVLSVLLPSEFSSSHSVEDAKALCHNLNSPYHIVEIKDTYAILNQTLQPIFDGMSFDLTEENMQARIRGTILMAISNKFGHILLNTSNKSEMAVGYGTLYGDMCGGLAVLGDLYKTEVYEMCHFINRNKEIIPSNTITKAPSAELRPGQKDQDSLPPYDQLDAILYQYIEGQMGPKEIVNLGHDESLVKRVLSMVNRNEFKRKQAAPILRISSKAFGTGRRIPIVAKYL